MDKADKIKVKNLIAKIANKYKLPSSVIESIVNSPYHFTYEKINEYNLDEVNSEEEASVLKTNFNYKGLGKLYLNYPSLVAKKIRVTNALEINSKRWKK